MSRQRAILFTVGAITLLGAMGWLGFATGRGGAVDAGNEVGAPDMARGATPPQVAGKPTFAPEPSAPAVVSPAITGLHVLCPVNGGGYAHLLLTADTYYKAVTPDEEAQLTKLLGAPVTNVDPTTLPPKSPMSVTDALERLAS